MDGASLPRHVADFFICTCAASTLVHFTAEIPRIEHDRKSQLINYLSMITCCRTPPGGRSSFIQSYAAHLAAGYRTETIDKIHFRVKQDVENMAHQQHRVSTCSTMKENTACVALDTWVLFREDTIEITMVSQ